MTEPPPRPSRRFVPSGRIIDVEPAGLRTWLSRSAQHLRGGLRVPAIFLLLFCGIIAGYFAVNILIVLSVIWWR